MSSGRNMVLGSTHALTEISTNNISWGTSDQCVRLTTLPASRADFLEIWEHRHPGNLRACPGMYRDCFKLQLIALHYSWLLYSAVDCCTLQLILYYFVVQLISWISVVEEKVLLSLGKLTNILVTTFITVPSYSPPGLIPWECVLIMVIIPSHLCHIL